MLEPEVVVEALWVLVLSALAVMVGLGLLVLLGKVDNPEWLEREDPQDRQDLKARRDQLAQLEAEELDRREMLIRDTATTPASTTPITPAKGKGETSDG